MQAVRRTEPAVEGTSGRRPGSTFGGARPVWPTVRGLHAEPPIGVAGHTSTVRGRTGQMEHSVTIVSGVPVERRSSAVWWNGDMYPGPDLLQEVGRVTIAGARLDFEMGLLWHHLDRSVPFQESRRASGAEQCRQVRRLATERLTGPMFEQVIALVEAAEVARQRRNEIIHQDWVLNSRDAMRSVAELTQVKPDDMPAYLEEWDRESKRSNDWQRIPSRGIDVVPAQTLDDLQKVERELATVGQRVYGLTFQVASSRETGNPFGYIHPTE